MAGTHQIETLPHVVPGPIPRIENREWWLWGLALSVTLALTLCILSLTLPGFLLSGNIALKTLQEWVRGLTALVLLFDVYTVYQHLLIQRIRQEMARREQLFHLIAENAADMIAVVDEQGRRIYNSPAYKRILGYTADELAATPSLDQVHPDDRERVIAAAKRAYLTGRGDQLEYRIRHKNGSWLAFESTCSRISNVNGERHGLVIVNRDITERKRTEALIEHQAFHDALTNLPNRLLLLDRLQRAIIFGRRHANFKFAVLFIDIDKFQVFNDSLGHAAGDELLIQVARRLTACLRNDDTVTRSTYSAVGNSSDTTLARPGGDEFVVLASELHTPSDAIRMARRIQERLGIPISINSQEIVLTASIGIVFGSDSYISAEDILRDAEIAMFRAKSAGKGASEVFDIKMQTEAVHRLQLETDLRRALECDEFRVYYQPIVNLQSGRIAGFEALSRWQRANGIALPSEFIRVAEEIGIILPMNRKLLREACLQFRQWHSLFPSDPPLALSVNVTEKEFTQPDLVAHIRTILQETGTDPRCIELEITENIAMADSVRSSRVLSELRMLGVCLSIDDFGTGFSSLCRLKSFPVNKLKIDRSFVSGPGGSFETREILRSIIILAHSLGLSVVAEGIEDKRHLEILRELGCELGQGYLFSKPQNAHATAQILADERRSRTGTAAGSL
jgi:PAS domain S-box-containing protein